MTIVDTAVNGLAVFALHKIARKWFKVAAHTILLWHLTSLMDKANMWKQLFHRIAVFLVGINSGSGFTSRRTIAVNTFVEANGSKEDRRLRGSTILNNVGRCFREMVVTVVE
jgi:hypothetical protein